MKKVLLTGPDGILGNNLVRMLLEKKYTVRVFIQSGKPEGLLKDLPVEKCWGNLLNREEVFSAIEGCDIVIHAAALTDTWPTRGKIYWDVNVEGTRNIIEAVKQHQIEKLLHIGTANSFGLCLWLSPGFHRRSCLS